MTYTHIIFFIPYYNDKVIFFASDDNYLFTDFASQHSLKKKNLHYKPRQLFMSISSDISSTHFFFNSVNCNMSVNIASSGTSFFPTKIEKEMQELHLNF